MKKIFRFKSKKQEKWSLEEEFMPAVYDIEEYKPSVEASPEALVLMESWLSDNSATANSSTNSILKQTNSYDITTELINTAQKSRNNLKVSFQDNNGSLIPSNSINDEDLVSLNSGDEQWSPKAEKFKSSSPPPPAANIKASFEYLDKFRDLAHLIPSPMKEFQEIPSPSRESAENHDVNPSGAIFESQNRGKNLIKTVNQPVDWLEKDSASPKEANQFPLSSSFSSSQNSISAKSTVITDGGITEFDLDTRQDEKMPTEYHSTTNDSTGNPPILFKSSPKLDKPLPPMPTISLPELPSIASQEKSLIDNNLSEIPPSPNSPPPIIINDNSSGSKEEYHKLDVDRQISITKSNSGSNFAQVNPSPQPVTISDQQIISMAERGSKETSLKVDTISNRLNSPTDLLSLTPSEDDALQWRKSSIQSSILFEVGDLNKNTEEENSDSIDYDSDDELPLSLVSSRLFSATVSNNSHGQITPRDSKPQLEFHRVETGSYEEISTLKSPIEMPPTITPPPPPKVEEAAPFQVSKISSPSAQAIEKRNGPPETIAVSSTRPSTPSSLRIETKLRSPGVSSLNDLNLDTTPLSDEIMKSVSPELKDFSLKFDPIPRPVSAPGMTSPRTSKTNSLKVTIAEKRLISTNDKKSSQNTIGSIDSQSLRDQNSKRPALIGPRPYIMRKMAKSAIMENIEFKNAFSVEEISTAGEQHPEKASTNSEDDPKLMNENNAETERTIMNSESNREIKAGIDEATEQTLDYSVESENLLSSVREYQPFAPASVARVKELQKTENGYQAIRNSQIASNMQATSNIQDTIDTNDINSSKTADQPLPNMLPPGHFATAQPVNEYGARFTPGYDPRFYPNYDPRYMTGYHPTYAPGYDPRFIPGTYQGQHTAFIHPHAPPGVNTAGSGNPAGIPPANYYYGDTRIPDPIPIQPQYVPPQFQSPNLSQTSSETHQRPSSQTSSGAFSSSLAGYPIQPPIVLKKTVPLAIPARNSSLYLSPTLKRLSMSLNKGNR